MSQPSAKRVKLSLNTRNKLIVNLKKKNLPNYVIKGLIGNYDNKNKQPIKLYERQTTLVRRWLWARLLKE